MSNHSPVAARRASDSRWHPTDYLRILYKRRWVAIPAFLLLFLLGAIQSIRTVPIYQATTQILVDQEAQRATSIENLLDERDGFDDTFYETQYRLMQSRSLGARTAAALDRTGPPERVPESSGPDLSLGGLIGLATSTISSLFSSGAGSQQEADAKIPGTELAGEATGQGDEVLRDRVDAFLAGLSIAPVRDSRLVDLEYQSPDPVYAARAANELARQYQQQALEARFMASKEANDWLSGQLEEQRKNVQESEAALQLYRETANASSVDDRQNIVIQKLTEMNAQLTRAKIDRLDKEAYYNRILEIQRNGESLESVPVIMANELVQSLKVEVNRLKSEQGQMKAKGFGEGWPAMKDLTSRIATAEDRLQLEMSKVVDSVRNGFLSARSLETSLAAALEAQKNESTLLDRKSIEYAALEREALGNRQLYEDLMQRTKQSGVSQEYRGGNVQIVDPAEVPGSPILPDVPQDLLVAGLKGGMFALLLVFGFEYFDGRLRSPEEIKTHLGLSFLGMVPLAGGKHQTGEALLLATDVPAAFSEAIRSVRTAVLFSSPEGGARSIVVTSTGPSEGKTVISSNLAISLAQAGQRTLLIDADMRRPRIHEALGRSQEPGLSNVLVGETKLVDAARPTSVANLSVLTAGHIPPNPAELVGSRKYLEVIDELKKRFDWIVVDAPPVMPVTDAAVLANSAGGVVFVVGSEMTTRQSAAAAIEQLRAANCRFIGAVLNRVNVERHHYYYSPYYRKEYGKYYQRSTHGA
jgi:capsular exopolysaccharide synthesis family protein